jgi:glutamate synthase (NADPH/NADH)
MCARDVDAYLSGTGTQLPVAGGIVKRVPYDLLAKMNGVKVQPEIVSVAAA